MSPRSRRSSAAGSRTLRKKGKTGAEAAGGEARITLSFTAVAPAKINLYLHVLGRRADGYHELDSLIAFADAHDIVCAEPADGLSLAIDGLFAHELRAEEDNLVLRAARALADFAGVRAGAHIILTKNLPVASGIGGGSADAAATLRVLRDLWTVDIDDRDMASLGLSIGADVPVCLFGHAARVQGIGEQLSPVGELPAAGIVLVNPLVAVATASVFKGRSGPYSSSADLPPDLADVPSLVSMLARCGNDLTLPAKAIAPVIGDVLDAIGTSEGCRLVRLSGSGATCFGLYDDRAAARTAARAIAEEKSSWWVHGGRLIANTPRVRKDG